MVHGRNVKILRMVELALLAAIVAILTLTQASIKLTALGTSITLVLIPVVLGALVLGPGAGAFLGFEFGMITYLMGVFGVDLFTFVLFQDHPIITALICIVKGTMAGLSAGLIYKALQNKKPYLGTVIAAASAPIANTGLFVLGTFFVKDTLQSNFVAEGQTVLYFVIIVCAGLNFILEFLLNMLAVPVLTRVVQALNKRVSPIQKG